MPGGFGLALDQSPCPCGGGAYRSCCGPLHRGNQRAKTAEQLMRSRYSAFARGEIDYLLATHPEPDVPAQQRRLALKGSCLQTCWLGLTVYALQGRRPARSGGSGAVRSPLSRWGAEGNISVSASRWQGRWPLALCGCAQIGGLTQAGHRVPWWHAQCFGHAGMADRSLHRVQARKQFRPFRHRFLQSSPGDAQDVGERHTHQGFS